MSDLIGRRLISAGAFRAITATSALILSLSALISPSSAAAPAVSTSQDDLLRFVSRPDLQPPRITVRTAAGGTTPGYVFLAPKTDVASEDPPLTQGGPEIVDDEGNPVWFGPRGDGTNLRTAAFQPQTYRGRPVLTWWEGYSIPDPELGNPYIGNWVIMDQSYHVIGTVKPGNGLPYSDVHDMQITPRNTALILVNQQTTRQVGDDRQTVVDNLIQEVDITSGRVLFQWSGLDHIPLSESDFPRNPAIPYHFLHLNSVSLDRDGNILASGRHTSTVYKIDRETGDIVWRLGGKNSDFTFEDGASFAWQHDVRRAADGTISVFDNTTTANGTGVDAPSRALVLNVDPRDRTVSVARSYPSPDGLLSGTQGSTRVLAGGNTFVGWGSHGYWTEFSADGKVLLDASFANPLVSSYRALRFTWRGTPDDRPAAAGRSTANGVTVYASWNGATDVDAWRVLAGDSAERLKRVAEVPRRGFETSAAVGHRARYVAVQALDARGRVLGTSGTAAVEAS